MLWHSNQRTDKVFRRCAGCKTCCNATADERCWSNLQGGCCIYLSQLSTTLGHQGQMMQLLSSRSEVSLLSPRQMISALCSSAWYKQLSCGRAPALTARAASCSAQSQHRPLSPNPSACHKQPGSIPPWKLHCPSTPADVYSACENCHPVQTSVRKKQSVNVIWNFDKICGEQLYKKLFQQIGEVVFSESVSGGRQQWWDAWDAIPACQ